MSRVIQFTSYSRRRSACYFHIDADAIVLHEAKHPTEVLFDKVDGAYHAIYQSTTLKGESTAKFQLPTGTFRGKKRNSINVSFFMKVNKYISECLSHLYSQLMQSRKESPRKFQASTRFEPMTPAILVSSQLGDGYYMSSLYTCRGVESLSNVHGGSLNFSSIILKQP